MPTIKEKAQIIRRKFPKVGRQRFRYRNPADLKSTAGKIYWFVLIFSPNHGESLMEFEWRRAQFRSPTAWAKWLREIGYNIFTQNVLPAINDKYGDEWIYRENLGFALQPAFRSARNDAICRGKDTPTRTRKQTRKKRKKPKRVSNRRG